MCLLGLKFGMVRVDECIESMGGFPDSNMTETNNSSIENHTYRLIDVLHGANVEFFLICACLDLNLAWLG